jgi:hypothetical protein
MQTTPEPGLTLEAEVKEVVADLELPVQRGGNKTKRVGVGPVSQLKGKMAVSSGVGLRTAAVASPGKKATTQAAAAANVIPVEEPAEQAPDASDSLQFASLTEAPQRQTAPAFAIPIAAKPLDIPAAASGNTVARRIPVPHSSDTVERHLEKRQPSAAPEAAAEKSQFPLVVTTVENRAASEDGELSQARFIAPSVVPAPFDPLRTAKSVPSGSGITAGETSRQTAATSVEQILAFTPPVREAIVGPAPSESRESEPTAPATRFDDWLKSPAAEMGRVGSPRPEHAHSAGATPNRGEPSVTTPVPGAITGEAKVQAVGVGTPDRGELAFAVHLQTAPLEAVTEQLPSAEPLVGEQTFVMPLKEAQASELMTEDLPTKGEEVARPVTERERKPAATERTSRFAPALEPQADAGIPSVKMAHSAHSAGPIAMQPAATTIGQPAGQSAVQQSPETPADARANDSGQGRTELNVDRNPEIQAGSARDIKLAVSEGDRRVEVRLSERSGEIRMAVRTQDSHLAGELRENLPQLTTRLAETGMHSEIWRPSAAAGSEWRHTAETPAGNLSQEGDPNSRGQEGNAQRDREQRQPRSFQEEKFHQEKGKDFAWLMSSLR